MTTPSVSAPTQKGNPVTLRNALPILLFTFSMSASFAGDDHGTDHHGHDGDQKTEQMHHDDDKDHMHESTHEESHPSDIGKPGAPENVSRTVAITMDDTLRFNPGKISVKAGETIRFFLTNNGKLEHEMVLGSMEDLAKHAEIMRSMPDMLHTEPNMARLRPGQRGGIIWQFDSAGTVDFACLIPGHMEAGMIGQIDVK
jgi:uncharacterized cupredoxin-like copper-binding protein